MEEVVSKKETTIIREAVASKSRRRLNFGEVSLWRHEQARQPPAEYQL